MPTDEESKKSGTGPAAPDLAKFRKLTPIEQEKVLEEYGNAAGADLEKFNVLYKEYRSAGGGTSVRKAVEDLLSDANYARYDSYNDAANTMVDRAAAGFPVSKDLDGDGYESTAERTAFDKEYAERKATVAAAAARAATANGATGEEADAAGKRAAEGWDGIFAEASGGLPDWVIAELGVQVAPTELVLEYNRLNPTTPVSNSAELAERLKVRTPENLELIDAAANGRDPIVESVWRVKGRDGLLKTVRLDAATLQAAVQGYTSDTNALGIIARAAARTGLQDASGNVAWQPLAALAKAAGLNVVVTGEDSRSADAAERQAAGRVSQLQNLGVKYSEGMKLYGSDPALAYVHALDPTLALRIGMSEGGKNLTGEDRLRASQLFLDGGFDPKTLASVGYTSFTSTFGILTDGGFLQQQLEDAKSGSGGRVRVMPDRTAIASAVQDMYRSLFLSDAPQSEIDRFTAQLEASVKGAADDQEIDAQAQLRKFAEGSSNYKDLYGNMPAGMTPEEYRAQFQGAVSDMLGNVQDPDSVRAGMRSGTVNTAVGSAFASSAGWQSSRLLGRLAEAATIVSAST